MVLPVQTRMADALDDDTQTLYVPLEDLPEITQSIDDRCENDTVAIASYMAVGTRKNQQDSIRVGNKGSCTVSVVCDGMGGLSGGERASTLAAEEMLRSLLENAASGDIPTEIEHAALKINGHVKNLRDDSGQPLGAGTTLTTVCVRGAEMYWNNVGDSHIYLFHDGRLRQLNLDHNLGEHLDRMVYEGLMSIEEARNHPQRAALTSYLGIDSLTLIGGNRTPIMLQKNDIVVQCTDGLYRCLSEEEMCHILADAGTVQEMAKALVECALSLPGAHDNTSVALTLYKG